MDEHQFDMSALQLGDRIFADGDDFEAEFEVIRVGDHPTCILIDPDDDTVKVVQLLGSMYYSSTAPDRLSPFCSGLLMPGFSRLIYAEVGANAEDVTSRSFIGATVKRNGADIFHFTAAPEPQTQD